MQHNEHGYELPFRKEENLLRFEINVIPNMSSEYSKQKT